MPEADPKMPVTNVTNASWFVQHYGKVMGRLAIVATAVTLWAVNRAWESQSATLVYVAILAWAIIPPVTFWWEYFFIYLTYGNPGTLEFFKYSQQVSAAVWAGMLVGLIAVGSSDHFKAKHDTSTDQTTIAASPQRTATPGTDDAPASPQSSPAPQK